MKIAAGPFSPLMKDWLTMLESSVDSDPSQGLHRQSKFRELSSRAFSRDFPTGKQPAGGSGNQVLHTKHLDDSKQGCQSPSVIALLSSTSASHCTQGTALIVLPSSRQLCKEAGARSQ